MRMGDFFDDTKGRDIPSGDKADRIRRAASDQMWGILFAQSGSYPAKFQQTANAMSVDTRDYVVQAATYSALEIVENNQQKRFSPEHCAKIWLLGFMSWYTSASQLTREDTDNHASDEEYYWKGVIVYCEIHYPRLNWSESDVKRANSLWLNTLITSDDLARIANFWSNYKVIEWQDVIIEPYGSLRLPNRVQGSAGGSINLGYEVVYDWILPKDDAHGVSLMVISNILQYILSHGNNFKVKSERSGTDGYEMSVGNQKYRLAFGTGRTVVSCFRIS